MREILMGLCLMGLIIKENNMGAIFDVNRIDDEAYVHQWILDKLKPKYNDEIVDMGWKNKLLGIRQVIIKSIVYYCNFYSTSKFLYSNYDHNRLFKLIICDDRVLLRRLSDDELIDVTISCQKDKTLDHYFIDHREYMMYNSIMVYGEDMIPFNPMKVLLKMKEMLARIVGGES